MSTGENRFSVRPLLIDSLVPVSDLLDFTRGYPKKYNAVYLPTCKDFGLLEAT